MSKGEDIVINDDLASLIASYDEVTSASVKGNIIEAVVDSYTFEVTSDLIAENKKEIAVVEPDNIEDWVYTINEEKNTVTIQGYRGDDTEIVIPNYINGIPVKRIEALEQEGANRGGGSDYSFWDSTKLSSFGYGWIMEDIRSITVSEGIEEIGYGTFYGTQGNIEEIKLPSTITTIESYAFGLITPNNKCSINIPISVTNVQEQIFGWKTGYVRDLELNLEANEIPSTWDVNWDGGISEENITINFGVK